MPVQSKVIEIAVPCHRVHFMAALVVGSLLSSNAVVSAAAKVDPATASAPARVVILFCSGFPPAALLNCDESSGVATRCPADSTSCAQAVAVFDFVPRNLQLINVSSPANNILIYSLGSKKEE
jgi:hypothetical protein